MKLQYNNNNNNSSWRKQSFVFDTNNIPNFSHIANIVNLNQPIYTPKLEQLNLFMFFFFFFLDARKFNR